MHSITNTIINQLSKISSIAAQDLHWTMPPKTELGDMSIPCFKLTKALECKSPVDAAQKLEQLFNDEKAPHPAFESVKALGPYLNIKLNHQEVLKFYTQLADKDFAQSKIGNGKTLIVEFSSPNIAKEFGVHHLRSTAIGHSLSRIAEHHGYYVHKINYLGDWGTSFGKYIVALNEFGSIEELKKNGLSYMMELYVDYNKKEKEDSSYTEKARQAFKSLEDLEPEATKTWEMVRDISLKSIKELYKTLDIEFDHFDGESFYQNELPGVIEQVSTVIGTEKSEGALICNLEGHEIPVLLQKKDGASLYITRDIAAAQDRKKRFNHDQCWYVVATQQNLHFKQLKDLTTQLDSKLGEGIEHIPFGMLSFSGKTMKTREGNILKLKDVINDGIQKAKEVIKEKNPTLENIDETADFIGTGALIFFDLSHNRKHDIQFDWNKALSFEGDTAPFIQYTQARINSLLEKLKTHQKTLENNDDSKEGLENFFKNNLSLKKLMNSWLQFENLSHKALHDRDPSQICKATLDVAKAFNSLYHNTRFLDIKNAQKLYSCLEAIICTRSILQLGLRLLGIRYPKKM